MKLKAGDSIAKGIGPFACPFCVGTFSVTEDPPAVAHTVPICSKFVECEPDAFLRAARLKREERKVS